MLENQGKKVTEDTESKHQIILNKYFISVLYQTSYTDICSNYWK